MGRGPDLSPNFLAVAEWEERCVEGVSAGKESPYVMLECAF